MTFVWLTIVYGTFRSSVWLDMLTVLDTDPRPIQKKKPWSSPAVIYLCTRRDCDVTIETKPSSRPNIGPLLNVRKCSCTLFSFFIPKCFRSHVCYFKFYRIIFVCRKRMSLHILIFFFKNLLLSFLFLIYGVVQLNLFFHIYLECIRHLCTAVYTCLVCEKFICSSFGKWLLSMSVNDTWQLNTKSCTYYDVSRSLLSLHCVCGFFLILSDCQRSRANNIALPKIVSYHDDCFDLVSFQYGKFSFI
jgi:hypothetical protein